MISFQSRGDVYYLWLDITHYLVGMQNVRLCVCFYAFMCECAHVYLYMHMCVCLCFKVNECMHVYYTHCVVQSVNTWPLKEHCGTFSLKWFCLHFCLVADCNIFYLYRQTHIHLYSHTCTHARVHIYIYIYIYMWKRVRIQTCTKHIHNTCSLAIIHLTYC